MMNESTQLPPPPGRGEPAPKRGVPPLAVVVGVVVALLAVIVAAKAGEKAAESQYGPPSGGAAAIADDEAEPCIDIDRVDATSDRIVEHLEAAATHSGNLDPGSAAAEVYAASELARDQADLAAADPAIERELDDVADGLSQAADDLWMAASSFESGDVLGAATYVEQATEHMRSANSSMEAATSAARATDAPAC